jgi:long-chain acyl-CoA synthetase
MNVGEHNLARLAEQAWERHGDYDTLFFEGRWYSYSELRRRTHRLANGFRELGIEPGDRVVVMMANCPEVGICYHALWRAGVVITPAIFLLQADDLRHILEHSEARAIITTPEFLDTIRTTALVRPARLLDPDPATQGAKGRDGPVDAPDAAGSAVGGL